MIDYTEGNNFRDNEKQISQYLRDRKDFYIKSKCRQNLLSQIKRLESSWDMEVPGASGNTYMSQMNYSLVKQVQLNKRALFSGNFRSDPIYTLRSIGTTPDENAINMQELLESNNQQTKFRPKFLTPAISKLTRWGTAVAFTEFSEVTEQGWQTVPDPVEISKRVYGVIKERSNAVSYGIDVRNYGQNPDIVSCDDSDFRYHMERWSLSTLESKYATNPQLYIKQNIEKVIKQVKKEQFSKDPDYIDSSGRESARDYGMIKINDITRGQAQIFLSGNSDDSTYYYYEMIGDTIIRFQENPYDMNMNQYTVMACEQRYEYFWGNTPAQYSIQSENTLNLLLGMSTENAIESMKRYRFYNSRALDPRDLQNLSFNADIPVDVSIDTNLSNILYQHQPQDTAGREIQQAFARTLEVNQLTQSTPDLNRSPARGGPSNKTATAAKIIDDIGANEDADLLEGFSHSLSNVGEKMINVLGQFVGNFGPIIIRPGKVDSIRELHKAQFMGEFAVTVDTSLKRSYAGEIQNIQNMTTWLLNLVQSGLPLQPNYEPMVRQVLKMGKMLNIDKILPEQEALQEMPVGTPEELPTPVPGGGLPGQEFANNIPEELPL